MNELTLIIPAKFESESLPIFLNELGKFHYKIMIVLESSDINTINSIRSFEKIEIIYQKSKGYGSAIREGIENIKTDYFCIINADGSMNPSELSSMFEELKKKELDFLFASRYEKDAGSEDDSLLTKFGNFIFTLMGKIFFNLKITDILFTYVLGKTKCFQKLDLRSDDFTLCVEFPIKSNRKNYKLGSIPSFERKRIGGKKKVNEFKDGFLILLKMINMFFKYD